MGFHESGTAKNFPESETNSDRPVSIYMKPHRAYLRKHCKSVSLSICSPERRRHDAACNNMGKLSGRTASVGGGSGGHRKRCTAAGTAETTEPPRAGTGDETLYRLCGNNPAECHPRTDNTGGFGGTHRRRVPCPVAPRSRDADGTPHRLSRQHCPFQGVQLAAEKPPRNHAH